MLYVLNLRAQIDVIKTRMQLQGEASALATAAKGTTTARAAVLQYRGFVHCFFVVAKEEGVRGLYRGLTPSLLREGSYSTLRMGLYEPFRALFSGDEPRPPLWAKIAAGAAAGATGAGIANPTGAVRMQIKSAY